MSPVIVLAASAITLSHPGVSITPPPGWRTDPALSQEVLAEFDKNTRVPGLDETRVLTGGASWVAPGDAGAVLHVTWMASNGAPTDSAAFVRAELEAAASRCKATETGIGTVEVVGWKEQVDEKQATGESECRQTEWGTRTLSRTTMFVDGKGNWRELRLDCVMRDDDTLAKLRPLCEAALASVTIDVPEAERRALGAVPSQGTLTVTGGMELVDEADGGGGEGELQTPTLSPDKGGAAVPEMPVPQAKAPAEERRFSRMLLVAGGIMVLIALALTMGRWKPKDGE